MATNNPSISLIVSTYNWPQALNLCLASILKQAVMPDEVIIADDGSTVETLELIKTYQHQFKTPLIHVWQEDDGFQLSRIRNKAIAKASKDYIIQIDGDLILEKNFVKDHLRFSKINSFVSGSRVIMQQELSKKLISGEKSRVYLISKGLINVLNGLRVPFLTQRMEDYRKEDIYYLRGCNMAFWRSDLVKVNGYNEDFAGWGREDNEIGLRLINSGVQKRIIKFAAVVFHIYHPETPRDMVSTNDELLLLTAKNKLRYCKKGLNQYL